MIHQNQAAFSNDSSCAGRVESGRSTRESFEFADLAVSTIIVGRLL